MSTAKFWITYLLGACFVTNASASDAIENHIGFRESDPASYVEDVSVINGSYTQAEPDLIVEGPDPLALIRFYDSRDEWELTNLGGWRIFPQCRISVRRDSEQDFETSEGRFQYWYCDVGLPEGSCLTFSGWRNTDDPSGEQTFHLDMENNAPGMANTAKGAINAWTNRKNHQLIYFEQDHHFELTTSVGGKRIYNLIGERYLLEYEMLPTDNRICYEYDELGRVIFVKITGASGEKVLSWMKICYGDKIFVEASDGKTVEYRFNSSGLLTDVIRSDRPALQYRYKLQDEHALLTRRDYPEGRYTGIIYEQNRVQALEFPDGQIRFKYDPKEKVTEVLDPLNGKTDYCYDGQCHLTAVRKYLSGSLYRVQKKLWGDHKDSTSLMGESIEDGSGQTFYFKSFAYDATGNVLEEQEYGNLTGANPAPVVVDEEGFPSPGQEFHRRTFAYKTQSDLDVVAQTDAKKNGVRWFYKRGTPILLKKFVLEGNRIRKRNFYHYDAERVLVREVVDDGDEPDEETLDCVTERHITTIFPKQEVPAAGAPEIIEEKFLDLSSLEEKSLRKTVNHFDNCGRIQRSDFYDADGNIHYSTHSEYDHHGRIIVKVDAAGNTIKLSYDANDNLISESRTVDGVTTSNTYDLKNRLIATSTTDGKGTTFQNSFVYNARGDLTVSVDIFGNETRISHDDLGRIRSISYPDVFDEQKNKVTPIERFEYDLFDHQISATDPKGNTTLKSYTLRGQFTSIHYPNGTQEKLKYDTEGSLHRHRLKNGTIKVFEYDYLGRVAHIEHNAKGEGRNYISSVERTYDAFHITREKDEDDEETEYKYDPAGRLILVEKGK